MKSRKGAAYERELCKEFSRWWTRDDSADDIFWRSSNSGGRATVRQRQGKRTSGHCGDIAATDPLGVPLVRAITFELKCGYTKCSFADAFDRAPHRVQSDWEGFVEQASTAATNAGTPFWALITRRNSRQSIIFIPRELFVQIFNNGGLRMAKDDDRTVPTVRLDVQIKKSDGSKRRHVIVGILLSDFFARVRPKHIPTNGLS